MTSSNIASIGFLPSEHQPDLGRLFIRYRDNHLYAWDEVAGEQFQMLMNSPSKGRFTHRNIVGKYPSQKLE